MFDRLRNGIPNPTAEAEGDSGAFDEGPMKLIGYMRAQYSHSKRLWYLQVLPLEIWVYGAALAASFPLPTHIAGLLVIATLLAQIAAFMLRMNAIGQYEAAEGIRRAEMLQNSLGISPSPMQLAKLQERTVHAKSEEAKLTRSYYDSDEPIGPRRLLDILSQAAFFTSAISRRTWKIFALIAIAGSAGPVLLVLLAVFVHASSPALEVVARVVVASMAFLAVGNVATMAIQFFQLSLDAERILDRCEAFLQQESPEMTDALLVFAEYNCAVIKAPPIPFRLYRLYRDRLNNAWEERKVALQSK